MQPYTQLAITRRAAGLTQTQLAERAACSKTAVTFYECGMRQPRLDIAAALARALGVSIEELFPEHCTADV